ncbi:MAG: superoxide dismutase family protein [Sphingomicrobium sp.]
MRKVTAIAAATAALVAASCAPIERAGGEPMPLLNSAGQQIGTVSAYQSAGGATLKIVASGLSHGIHGLHVHSVGRCDGPDFKSAGGHWNPANRKHGFNNSAGPHAGDMSNVSVAANGVLEATLAIPNADISVATSMPGALIDMDGAALVIHAAADDYQTDPSGNSGDRVACAVLVPTSVHY